MRNWDTVTKRMVVENLTQSRRVEGFCMRKEWRKAILENIPYGADATLDLLDYEDASRMQKILVDNGYACLLTGGSIGETYKLQWIYSGGDEDISFSDSDKVAFFSIGYLWDYPEALQEEYEEYREEEE